MLPLDGLLWRAAAVAALVSALGAQATTALRGVTGSVDAQNKTLITAPPGDSQQVLTVPLRRINHRGVATPSIVRRFSRTDVLGVFGAAYLAECMC